jgi:hypothetical protein
VDVVREYAVERAVAQGDFTEGCRRHALVMAELAGGLAGVARRSGFCGRRGRSSM